MAPELQVSSLSVGSSPQQKQTRSKRPQRSRKISFATLEGQFGALTGAPQQVSALAFLPDN